MESFSGLQLAEVIERTLISAGIRFIPDCDLDPKLCWIHSFCLHKPLTCTKNHSLMLLL